MKKIFFGALMLLSLVSQSKTNSQAFKSGDLCSEFKTEIRTQFIQAYLSSIRTTNDFELSANPFIRPLQIALIKANNYNLNLVKNESESTCNIENCFDSVKWRSFVDSIDSSKAESCNVNMDYLRRRESILQLYIPTITLEYSSMMVPCTRLEEFATRYERAGREVIKAEIDIDGMCALAYKRRVN